MLEYVILITLVLMGLMSLIIIFKYFISNDKISHLLSKQIVTKENKTYIIKVDFEYQKLTFTWRSVGEDSKTSANKCSIVSKEFSFNDFIEKLPCEEQIKFHDFLFNDCLSDNKKSKITININELFGEKNKFLQLTYLEKYSYNVFYIKGVKVYKPKIDRNQELLDLQAFKNKLTNMYPSVDKPIGSIYLFTFNSYDFYNKRYGIEVATDYLNQMWDELNNLFKNRGFVGHVDKDTFIAYFDKKTKKNDIIYFLHTFVMGKTFEFGIDNLERKNIPTVGIVVYGEFSKDFNENLKYLNRSIQKANESINDRYKIYDQALHELIENEILEIEQVRKDLERHYFKPVYSPIISLNNGETYGFFTGYDLSNEKIRYISNLLDESKQGDVIDLKNTFFSKSVSNWFSFFLNNAEMDYQKIFIYTKFENIDSLINTYTSNEDYDKINLVAVITKYSDILKDPDLTKRKLNELKSNGIQIGIVASLELQSVLSQELNQFTYLVIPRQLTKDIILNPRTSFVLQNILDMTHDFYMENIAVDIDNYQEAEVLKEMNVFYMHGNLFDPKKSNISMRRLAHLYDESN